MNFVHITDTHFRHQPMERNEHFPLDKIVDWDGVRLREVLRSAKSQKLDFVVITGDLVHESNAEDYRLFKILLDEELPDVPYYVALGNHDRRAAFFQGFWGKQAENAPYYSTFDQDGLRIIALDSCLEDGYVKGQLGEAQLDFLKAELANPSPKGTLILMHHPMELVYKFGHGMVDGHGLVLGNDAEALSTLIAQSDVHAVLSGHTHFPSIHSGGGALFATASGSAFGLDPTNQSTMIFQNTASYFMGRVEEGKVFIGQVNMPFSGEVLFEIDLSSINHMIGA